MVACEARRRPRQERCAHQERRAQHACAGKGERPRGGALGAPLRQVQHAGLAQRTSRQGAHCARGGGGGGLTTPRRITTPSHGAHANAWAREAKKARPRFREGQMARRDAFLPSTRTSALVRIPCLPVHTMARCPDQESSARRRRRGGTRECGLLKTKRAALLFGLPRSVRAMLRGPRTLY